MFLHPPGGRVLRGAGLGRLPGTTVQGRESPLKAQKDPECEASSRGFMEKDALGRTQRGMEPGGEQEAFLAAKRGVQAVLVGFRCGPQGGVKALKSQA